MKKPPRFKYLRENYYTDKGDTSFKDLSVLELSRKLNIDRNKIDRLENGSAKQYDLQTIEAYCDFFHCSADYLLGLSEHKTKDEDMKMICDTTGLSEESVKNLKELQFARLLQAGSLGIAELNIIDLICNDIKELQSFEIMMTEYIKLEYSIQEQSVPTIPVYRTKDEYNNIEYHSDFIADSDRYSSILFLSDTPSGHSKIKINITPQLLKTNIEEQIRLWANSLGHTYYKNNKNIDNQRKDK